MNRLRIAICLSLLLVPAGIASADGASLYVTPETGTYTIGETFDVQVLADSGGAPINAAEADITFDPAALSVVSLSKDGSLLSTWPAQPSFSNTEGTIGFSGVAASKYTGSAGLLITITFKALQNGQDGAHFASGAILAADGIESNIITSMHSSLYTIQPVEVPAQSGNADAIAPAVTDASATSTSASNTSDSISAPVLINYQSQVGAGDRIVVQGTAPAGSTVSLWLQEGNKKPQRTDLDADSSGSFIFTSDIQAKAGPYHVWAYTLGAAGLQSEMSNKIAITAIDTNTASVALLQQTLIANIVPVTALLVFAGVATAYLYHRHRIEKYRIEVQSKS